MSVEPLWMGVDLGTQSVKVTVIDDDGRTVARADVPLRSHRAGRIHEQDPRDWRRSTAAAVSDAVRQLGPARDRIGGLSMCSTSGTITLLDDAAGVAAAGIMYDDARGEEAVASVRDADPDLWARLGYRPQPSWPICTLAWWARRGEFRSERVATQGDIVAATICGHPVATDWTSALKLGYDTQALAWPQALLSALGVASERLPEVVAPGTALGVSSAEWESQTGLPSGVTVYAGLTDGCAAQLASGAMAPGDWHTVLGTTLVFKGVSPRPISDAGGAVYSHRSPDDGLWLPGGASSVGAGVLATQATTGAQLDELADRAVYLDPTRAALCYPLTGIGERFPIIAPEAAGFVRTDEGDSALSSLEQGHPETLLALFVGVGFVERLGLELLAHSASSHIQRISSSGGGTRSALWNRLRATILDRPITVVSADGATGAAMLAAWGAGPDKETLAGAARRRTVAATVAEPNPTWTAGLADRYQQFRQMLAEHGWMADQA